MSGFLSFNAGGLSQGFSDLGGAVSDLFGAMGAGKEAQGYGEAAHLASQDATLALESSKVQQYQQQRQANIAIGAEQAAFAGNNLTGGSGADLLRSSAQQASLGHALLGLQGQMTSVGYEQQAQALEGEQAAAKAAHSGGIFGSILGAVGAVASIL